MSKNNISTIYQNLNVALKHIENGLDKKLPKLSGDKFLESFGTEFETQLSDQGKAEFQIFKQTIFSSTLEKFDTAKEAREKIYKEAIKEFLTKFDLDKALHNAQIKLNKNKESLLKSLNNLLSENTQSFDENDRDKIRKAFTEKLDKDYQSFSNHLEGWKSLLPSSFAKIKFHLEAARALNKQKKNNDFTLDKLPELEDLQIPVKPEPKVGYKVDIQNIKQQILNDIANEKEITIKLIDTQNYSQFKQIADIGFQTQRPHLALLHLIILLFAKIIYNNEKRTIQAIQELIKEGHLIDPKKIKLKIVNPRTANENEVVVRKEEFLDEKTVNKLESLVIEKKAELSNYHLQEIRANKFGLTEKCSDDGYGTEDEEQVTSRPNGP